jgi:hypothetical protein
MCWCVAVLCSGGMMKSKALAVIPVMLGLVLGGCGSQGETPTTKTNNSPVISAMALSAGNISQRGSVVLTVTASDPDGDALTYTFSRGTCDGSLSGGVEGTPQAANSVTFNAGTTIGACQLEATVTDSGGLTAHGTVTLDIDPTRFIVTPSAPLTLSNVAGVDGDGAPGFEEGSIRATGFPKAELYFKPSDLFGHAVTLGDVARMSYWTKKGTTHVDDVYDWYLAIYTKPYAGQASGWYGARIGAEPYLAASLVETAAAWNLWSTDGQFDQLRFFESTYGYYGSYTDPSWSDFVAGSSLVGTHTSTSVPYGAQEILYFSVQTASSATGFDGQLDGVRVELKDGTVVVIDMQPSPTVPVFNTIPDVLPPNLPSQPFQAQQTAEFGDYITLAPGTGRHAAKATVVMVTWSTEAYSHPITLNLYNGSSGALTWIGGQTQTFDIPARPAADLTCPDPYNYGPGSQWRAANGQCYYGYAFPITFDLTDVSVVLPDSFAYGVAYDTNNWGYYPIHEPGPYESLNVGVIGDGGTVASTQPSIGTDPDPDALLRNYWNFNSGAYTGFVPETGWTGYAPAVEFFAY